MSPIAAIAKADAVAVAERSAAGARREVASGVLPLVVSKLVYCAGGHRLLDEISFTLRAGANTMLLGPNGAGKSLLLRLCHGLLEPERGSVSWGGEGAKHAHRWVSMVFQKPVLLRRSAAANIDYALAVKGVPRVARKVRVNTALADAGLEHLARRPARVLSGGEQQRLAIARAWASQPRVLLLDEPTSNLDPAATRAIETLIQSIRRAGARIIMSTHDLAQARRLGDDVLFIHKGRVLEHTPAGDFFECPRSAPARAFLRGDLLS
ncbi:MAG: ATP-binding cassette domain-containing protein [Gammaproteobacteria bacterium]|nr:ATP-binding cassette domain-containing protein [Gammaproteobacteria bacterium]